MSTVRRYAREIERGWTGLLERPAVLGERDWSLICDWYARGIPLALIREVFEDFAATLRRRRRRPRNLGAVAPRIEEAWRTVSSGRVDEPGPTGAAPAGGSGRDWGPAVERLPRGERLRDWLLELLADLAAGRSAARCEEALREGLLAHLPAPLLAELEGEVDADLAPLRERMSGETWRATRRRALISTARRRLGLAATPAAPGIPASRGSMKPKEAS